VLEPGVTGKTYLPAGMGVIFALAGVAVFFSKMR